MVKLYGNPDPAMQVVGRYEGMKTVIDGRELKMPGNMPVSSTSFVIYK